MKSKDNYKKKTILRKRKKKFRVKDNKQVHQVAKRTSKVEVASSKKFYSKFEENQFFVSQHTRLVHIEQYSNKNVANESHILSRSYGKYWIGVTHIKY